MTLTRFTLQDVPGALSWVGVLHFVENLDPSARTWQAMNPEGSEFSQWAQAPGRQAAIAADTYDLVAQLMWAYVCANSKSRPKQPKPYPRPGVGREETRNVGKGAIPMDQFDAWWEDQAAERGES